MKTKLICVVLLLVLSLVLFLLFKENGKATEDDIVLVRTDTVFKRDTLIIRDTLRIKEPVPYFVKTVRVDTLLIRDSIPVALPIERKEYLADTYRAVIEGYNAALLSMETYNTTTFVTDTVIIYNSYVKTKSNRLVVSAGVGLGLTPRGLEPHVGIGVGYVLWTK